MKAVTMKVKIMKSIGKPMKIIAFLFAAIPVFLAPPAFAETGDGDVIIEAMSDEMNRAMKSLRVEKMEKPYYLEYTILDQRQLKIEGSFGALEKSGESHQRLLKVGVRIGNYQLDNTEFIGKSNMFAAIMGHSARTVIDDDYDALRRDIWLTTDRAYKQALENLAEKQAYIKNQVQKEQVPDFSREEPVRLIAPRKQLKTDRGKWEKTVKDLSAIFRDYPSLYESYVEMKVSLVHKYYVNSEGTVYRQPETLASLVAIAITQARDGMKLKHYVPFYASTADEIPPKKELAAGIRKMAGELSALVSAPVLESYIGPVLFTRQASAELFAQVMLPHLSGQHPPLSSVPQISQMTSASRLVRRLNRKVLPRNITVIDDPTRSHFDKTSLIGSYAIDDQGVVSRPLNLVEKGVLKNLLMSRRPGKVIVKSNGHGRAGLMGSSGVQIGNLIITTENGKNRKQLKKKLREMCKEQQVPYGLLVKTFDNPAITGLDESTSARLMQNPQNPSMTAPVLIYRVYAKDGREELVRGITIAELTVNDLKYISAVGNDAYVHHREVAPAGGIMGSVFSLFSSGSGSGMRIPVSIVAPSLLFEEVEFESISGKRNKPPLMPHPFFSQKNNK
ncbi:MAG: hypothetical protein GY940_14350 [bacterium]|nr:hypothetical protein [bacterium]